MATTREKNQSKIETNAITQSESTPYTSARLSTKLTSSTREPKDGVGDADRHQHHGEADYLADGERHAGYEIDRIGEKR